MERKISIYIASIALLLLLPSLTFKGVRPVIHRVVKMHSEFVKEEIPKPAIYVTATTYNAEIKQTDSTPKMTSAMYHIDKNPFKHRYIALSKDLLKIFPYGTEIRLKGTGIYDGIYIVADMLNTRYRRRVDILLSKGMKHLKAENCIISKR